jgi:hypothetical protein
MIADPRDDGCCWGGEERGGEGRRRALSEKLEVKMKLE